MIAGWVVKRHRTPHCLAWGGYYVLALHCAEISGWRPERQTEEQVDKSRQTGRNTDGQANIWTLTQTERKTNWQIERHDEKLLLATHCGCHFHCYETWFFFYHYLSSWIWLQWGREFRKWYSNINGEKHRFPTLTVHFLSFSWFQCVRLCVNIILLACV